MTRTHTVYWSDDSLEGLREEARVLRIDMEERAPFMDEESRLAMSRRMTLLDTAIVFMGDKAD